MAKLNEFFQSYLFNLQSPIKTIAEKERYVKYLVIEAGRTL